LVDLLKNTLETKSKSLTFIQSSLTSAKAIYKHGGHVTMQLRDQTFRLHFDNRRSISDGSFEGSFEVERLKNSLLDSEPLENVDDCRNLRSLMKFSKQKSYNKLTSGSSNSKYLNSLDVAVRTFLKGLMCIPPKYNLHNDFECYNDIIDYLKSYDIKIKVSKSNISRLKNRNMIFRSVPRTSDTLKFAEFLKLKYPDFDETSYFKL
jgi:hypothetical protein